MEVSFWQTVFVPLMSALVGGGLALVAAWAAYKAEQKKVESQLLDADRQRKYESDLRATDRRNEAYRSYLRWLSISPTRKHLSLEDGARSDSARAGAEGRVALADVLLYGSMGVRVLAKEVMELLGRVNATAMSEAATAARKAIDQGRDEATIEFLLNAPFILKFYEAVWPKAEELAGIMAVELSGQDSQPNQE